MKAKTIKRLRNTTAVFLAVLLFFFAVGVFFLIASLTTDLSARTLPSYPKLDLSPILAKDPADWTEEDYTVLSRQTGILSREVLKERTASEIEDFQKAFFFEGTLEHEEVSAGLVYRDILYDDAGADFFAPIVPLEPGDVLITSASHLFGWRHGHAALVLSGRRFLQAAVIGMDSLISSFGSANGTMWFAKSSNFMVLRLKGATAEERQQLADAAETCLVGIPYRFTAGIFTPKDQGTHPTETYCSHLVWQAYKNAGYDIDSDGGPVCTPRDIANSPHFEVVQIYGFDIDKGW